MISVLDPDPFHFRQMQTLNKQTPDTVSANPRQVQTQDRYKPRTCANQGQVQTQTNKP